MEGREEDPEFALSASFIGPQSHHAYRGCQHDIVGHRGAELIFQVLDWTAAIVNGDKVTLALIWVVHLVLKESHVDLWVQRWIERRKSAVSGPGEWRSFVFKSKYLRLIPDVIQSPKGHFSFIRKKLHKTTTEQEHEINNSHTQTLAFGGALMYHLQSTASVCSARLSADIWTDSTKPSGPLSSKSQAANANLQLTECLIDNTNQITDGDWRWSYKVSWVLCSPGRDGSSPRSLNSGSKSRIMVIFNEELILVFPSQRSLFYIWLQENFKQE